MITKGGHIGIFGAIVTGVEDGIMADQMIDILGETEAGV